MKNDYFNDKLLFADKYATISHNPTFLANQLSKIIPSLQYLEPSKKKDKFLAKNYSLSLNSLKICDSFMSPTKISSTDGNEYTLMLPIKGSCTTTIENKDFIWDEKSFAFIKTKTGAKSISEQNRNIILIDILPQEFNKQAKIMLNDESEKNFFDFENPSLIPLKSYGVSFDTILLQLCKVIGNNINSIQNLEKAKFDELIYRTLVMMFLPQNFYNDESIKTSNKVSTSTIKLIKELENEDYFSFMSLCDLEQFLDLSTRNLQLLFRKNFNITPTQFLREQKLKHAKKLILESNCDLTISQIALEIGFFNFSQFTKYYKEYHGVLPSETKKSFK